MRDIAIVGGGPAGAMCGERLARSGYNVTIYDEHLAWEKPCGGGLTHKAIQAYPFLLNGPHPKKLIRSIELISSKGHRALLALDQPIVIYSRTVLNGLLLGSRRGCGMPRGALARHSTRYFRGTRQINDRRERRFAGGGRLRRGRRRSAQFPASRHPPAGAQRSGNDARLFRSGAGRGDLREISPPL